MYCVDCEQYLCDQAARLHGRTRATREHAVVPMEDMEFRQAKPSPQCPFHHMPIEYLCLEDDCLVCVKCLPCPIHNGHRCKAIPEALADETRSSPPPTSSRRAGAFHLKWTSTCLKLAFSHVILTVRS